MDAEALVIPLAKTIMEALREVGEARRTPQLLTGLVPLSRGKGLGGGTPQNVGGLERAAGETAYAGPFHVGRGRGTPGSGSPIHLTPPTTAAMRDAPA